MTGVLLAIDLTDAMMAAKSNECRQRDFGCIGRATEHGFSKNRSAQRDAVESPYKSAVDPCFHTVRKSRLMQISIGGNHVGHDPRARLALAGA